MRLKLSRKVSNYTKQTKMPKKGWLILIKLPKITGEANNVNLLISNTFVFGAHK